ncbi:MAG: M1 family metallopeptidase, partial [Chitinophagaceae bacterium]|nr:M1 family metallopeptidase [Chitinophagaceae bacterium]
MKKIFLVYVFLCQLLLSLSKDTYCQVNNYFQQQVNYNIDVSLNDADNTLNGFIKIDYTNNSPDTLQYIWFHLWPDAYKNDRTAFSDQLLENGRTDFYFSDNDKRGYINRLEFKVNGLTARLIDHPQYIDIAKLLLPALLIPGQTITITTPFHVKLPYNFSRGGHVGQSYQVTQWYPKPAVYDKKGWHPMPYLDQGEFYSEFGNFDVQITLPKNYVVAATGELQNEEERKWLIEKSKEEYKSLLTGNIKTNQQNIKTKKESVITSSAEVKTVRYIQNKVHDFAWFADKKFLVRTDTMKLSSGRIIGAWAFFSSSGYATWKNSIQFIKDAIKTRSEWLGEYPYNIVTALEAPMGFSGGMEYPTITSISPLVSEKELDLIIAHEVGHNWNYGIIATNERQHPWMDEGITTYFDNRYIEKKYPASLGIGINTPGFFKKRLPQDVTDWAYRTLISIKKDQAIETSADKFSELNNSLVAYFKTSKWMKLLENFVGSQLFDSSLHEYYNRWKFKHPYPEDFKKVVEDVSRKNVDTIFSLLNKRGDLQTPNKKTLKLMSFFSFKETDKHNYIFIAPSIGFNHYDKFMVGGLLHNYTLPLNRFQFFLSPMYGTQSKKLTGLARAGYNWFSYGGIQKTELSVAAASFSISDFTDSAGNTKYSGFNKIVPSLKIIIREKNDRSTFIKWLQWKTFFIQEEELSFNRDTINDVDIITYPKLNRYLNQLKLVVENNRVLYPFKMELQAEQGKHFVRTAFTGNYLFNYKKWGGMDVRLFAGKFIYLGDKTFSKQSATDRYHLNMTGANGYEDYTYSNYFVGRNEFEKSASQQIMIRDGGFKVRTGLLAAKVGKTGDWLAAINFKTTIPKNVNPLEALPIKIPIKLFFDIGTYA